MSTKRLLCVVAAMLAWYVEALATTITINSVEIPNWYYTTSGDVHLRIYANQAFVTSAGVPIQAGSPEGGATYKVIVCTVNYTTHVLTIPQFTIDSTTDSLDPQGRTASYAAWFYTPTGRKLAPYQNYSAFRVPSLFPNSQTTTGEWKNISDYNNNGVPFPIDRNTYDRETIDRKISAAVITAGGLFTLNGLSSGAQFFVNGTNVTITSSGSNHTLGWTGTLNVPSGGTGAGTWTTNGVLYGNGTGALQATSAPTAYSILTGNAGAPTWSQTPQINTSLTLGVSSSQTGSLRLNNATNAFGLTLTTGAPTANITFTMPTTVGTAGQVLTTDGNNPATLSWTTVSGASGVSGSGASPRVAYWSGTTTIAGDGGLNYDATNDRLSIGTTDSSYTLNLVNGGYISGRGTVAGAQVPMMRMLYGTGAASGRETATATFADIDLINLGTGTTLTHTITDSGATAINPLNYLYQDVTNGGRSLWATSGSYNDSTESAIFHTSHIVRSIGSAATVAVFGEGIASHSTAAAWGGNFVGYVDVTGGTAFGSEVNWGILSPATNGNVAGVMVAASGNVAVSGGNNGGPAIKIQTNAGKTPAKYGLMFGYDSAGTVLPATDALIYADTNGTTPLVGIDLSPSAFTVTPIKLRNNALIAANTTGGTPRGIIGATSGDGVQIGDSASWAAITFLPGTTEAMRITSAKLVGFNQSSPTRMLHGTAEAARTVATGASGNSIAVVNGSPTVTGTGTSFLNDLAPGSTIEFGSDPGVLYQVSSITSNTVATLTANYTGPNPGAPGTSAVADNNMFLLEGEGGNDFVEVTGLGVLRIYGEYAQAQPDNIPRGMLEMIDYRNTNRKLVFGYDHTDNAGFINAFDVGTGWTTLVLQGSGASSNAKVGIRTAAPQGGLHVYGAGVKTGTHINFYCEDVSTSSTAQTKLASIFDSNGSWVGYNMAMRVTATGSSDGNDRTNYPALFRGGGVLIAPQYDSPSQVTAPVPATLPQAMLHVYGYQAKRLGGTVQTYATDQVDGTGTSFDSTVRPGDAIMFGSDTTVYQVKSVESATDLTLTSAYAGTPASGVIAYGNMPLVLVENGYGTDVLTIHGGTTTIGNSFIEKRNAAALASAATLVLTEGNIFHVSGTTQINTIRVNAAGTYVAHDGQTIKLIFDGDASVGDMTGNVDLRSGTFLAHANASLTLVYDSTTARWYELARVQQDYASVASSATLTLPAGGVISVTGSTTITGISTGSSIAGRQVTLVWASGATFDVTDGGNLRLNGSITTWDSDDTLTLVCDGTNWYEVARTAN